MACCVQATSKLKCFFHLGVDVTIVNVNDNAPVFTSSATLVQMRIKLQSVVCDDADAVAAFQNQVNAQDQLELVSQFQVIT